MDAREWSRWWRLVGHEGMLGVLSVDWDPIGLGPLLPHDEYECVTDSVAHLLRQGAAAASVASALARQRTDHFGLEPDLAADRRAAGALIAWYRSALEDHEPGDIRAL